MGQTFLPCRMYLVGRWQRIRDLKSATPTRQVLGHHSFTKLDFNREVVSEKTALPRLEKGELFARGRASVSKAIQVHSAAAHVAGRGDSEIGGKVATLIPCLSSVLLALRARWQGLNTSLSRDVGSCWRRRSCFVTLSVVHIKATTSNSTEAPSVGRFPTKPFCHCGILTWKTHLGFFFTLKYIEELMPRLHTGSRCWLSSLNMAFGRTSIHITGVFPERRSEKRLSDRMLSVIYSHSRSCICGQYNLSFSKTSLFIAPHGCRSGYAMNNLERPAIP